VVSQLFLSRRPEGVACGYDGLQPVLLQEIEAWSPRTELGKALRDVALALSGTTRSGTHGRLLEVIGKRMRPKLLYAASALLGIINECDAEVAKEK